MNLSRKWLEEFVHVDASDKEFAEAMTLSGSKVELTHDLGEEISNVVVGKVLSMEHHPDSDHMWICQIDVGQAELPRSSPAHGISMWAIWCRGPAQVPAPQRHENRKGQAPGRGVQRDAVLSEGAGPHRRARLPLRPSSPPPPC